MRALAGSRVLLDRNRLRAARAAPLLRVQWENNIFYFLGKHWCIFMSGNPFRKSWNGIICGFNKKKTNRGGKGVINHERCLCTKTFVFLELQTRRIWLDTFISMNFTVRRHLTAQPRNCSLAEASRLRPECAARCRVMPRSLSSRSSCQVEQPAALQLRRGLLHADARASASAHDNCRHNGKRPIF